MEIDTSDRIQGQGLLWTEPKSKVPKTVTVSLGMPLWRIDTGKVSANRSSILCHADSQSTHWSGSTAQNPRLGINHRVASSVSVPKRTALALWPDHCSAGDDIDVHVLLWQPLCAPSKDSLLRSARLPRPFSWHHVQVPVLVTAWSRSGRCALPIESATCSWAALSREIDAITHEVLSQSPGDIHRFGVDLEPYSTFRSPMMIVPSLGRISDAGAATNRQETEDDTNESESESESETGSESHNHPGDSEESINGNGDEEEDDDDDNDDETSDHETSDAATDDDRGNNSDFSDHDDFSTGEDPNPDVSLDAGEEGQNGDDDDDDAEDEDNDGDVDHDMDW
ncbi:hypothetical protein ml_357 [Mollivirus sibericum]|uniref:hypothetical protein n=1 Tax=Mollivirus sibericum TaxID=1678078 RepID=UPI0006B2EFC8|nr:hypothetical protein ml_357 [Mollivirus sibericum]ALD62159.1 hypothetical protein ml_357 [Mollivirus sibericum]